MDRLTATKSLKAFAAAALVSTCLLEVCPAATREVVAWKGAGLAVWNRVFQIRDLVCRDEGLSFLTDGSDPQLSCRTCNFDSSPSQFLRLRVRSSVGGKTGIDAFGVKNIIGAFKQPKKVLIDPDVLSTLPERQINNGLCEAMKTAARPRCSGRRRTIQNSARRKAAVLS